MSLQRGFTMTELMVVISILMVLAALLQPVIQSALVATSESTCRTNLRQMGVSIQLYRHDWDGNDVGQSSSELGLPSLHWVDAYLNMIPCHGRNQSGTGTPGFATLYADDDPRTIELFRTRNPQFLIDWPGYSRKFGVDLPIVTDANHQRHYPINQFTASRAVYLTLSGEVRVKTGMGDPEIFDYYLGEN